MNQWKMLTLVGEDKPGIVAQVTDTLYRQGLSLGESSMIRLGGNFTIMMMISCDLADEQLQKILQPVATRLQLHMHIDTITGGLHQHIVPNYQVRVVGADRAGIVAQVTGSLAKEGFNILELESDVAGTQDNPVYIMTIQGYTDAPLEQLQTAVTAVCDDMDVNISPIEILIG